MVETKVLAVCGGLVIVVAFGIYVCSWKLRRVRSDDQEVVPVVAVQHVRQVSRALLTLFFFFFFFFRIFLFVGDPIVFQNLDLPKIKCAM
jgi:hypothetical protein